MIPNLTCLYTAIYQQRRMRKLLNSAGVLAILGTMGGLLYLQTPCQPKPDAQTIRDIAAKYDARIIRDEWGVPHIFGKTDADASFGYGYAHAEDDWKHIQESLMGARGMTSQYKGKDSAPQDYLYDCLLYTSPSPRDATLSRMPSSA